MKEQDQGSSRRLLKGCIAFFSILLVIILIAEGRVLSSDFHAGTAKSPPEIASSATGSSSTTGSGTQTSSPCQPTPLLASCSNAQASADITSSQVQLFIEAHGLDCGTSLVFKSIQPVYDQGTIQQISEYVSGGGSAGGELPSDLQLVAGGATCMDEYDITNAGTQSIQISGMGLRLSKNRVQNTFSYKLLDACTLSPAPKICSCTNCGSGTDCIHVVDIDLSANDDASYKEGTVDTNGDCVAGPWTVEPGDNLQVDLYVSSTPVNMIYYSVTPTISLGAGSSQMILPLPSSFTSTLVFAGSNLFSCYGFHGQKLVREPVIRSFNPDCT